MRLRHSECNPAPAGRYVGKLVAVLLGALLLALPATAGATPPGPPIEVGYGSGYSQGAIYYRQDLVNAVGDPILTPGQNVAVIYYKDPNDPTRILGWARESSALELGRGGHSEAALEALVREKGINPDDVVALYSEFEPCSAGPNCAALVARTFRNAQIYYTWKYGTPAEKAASRLAHQNAIRRLNTQIRNSKKVMNSSCSAEGGSVNGETGGLHPRGASSPSALADTAAGCAPGEEPEPQDGPLSEELSDPAQALDPGGIDFTSLQLRYLSLGGPHRGDMQYAMDSDGAPVSTDPGTGLQTALEDSNAFFTWLTLPPRSFWVNLAPNYPPKIIDPTFALTDAGHVLLQSDLLLKEAASAALNPANPAAAQFWQQVIALPAAGDTFTSRCVGFRIWIVPDVATVHATKNQLYILSAPLRVMMAVVTHYPGRVLFPLCPQDAWHTGYEAAYRQLILPILTQQVNTAPQFEPLRRVYMSRVAAQWARQAAGHDTALGRLVNSGLHQRQRARPPWSPDAIWEQLIQLLDAPPAQYTLPVQQGGTTLNYTVYVNGGVDFTHKVRVANTTNREFTSRWPGLATAAKRAPTRASTADGTTLVGGGVTTQPRRHGADRRQRPTFVRVPPRLVPQRSAVP